MVHEAHPAASSSAAVLQGSPHQGAENSPREREVSSHHHAAPSAQDEESSSNSSDSESSSGTESDTTATTATTAGPHHHRTDIKKLQRELLEVKEVRAFCLGGVSAQCGRHQ